MIPLGNLFDEAADYLGLAMILLGVGLVIFPFLKRGKRSSDDTTLLSRLMPGTALVVFGLLFFFGGLLSLVVRNS
jgi:hypothetical protein